MSKPTPTTTNLINNAINIVRISLNVLPLCPLSLIHLSCVYSDVHTWHSYKSPLCVQSPPNLCVRVRVQINGKFFTKILFVAIVLLFAPRKFFIWWKTSCRRSVKEKKKLKIATQKTSAVCVCVQSWRWMNWLIELKKSKTFDCFNKILFPQRSECVFHLRPKSWLIRAMSRNLGRE